MHLLRKARPLQGSIDFNGLQISIETGRSRCREWKNPHDGSQGMSRMTLPYGYIKGTLGTDGDHVDCFVGQDREAPEVYVIHTLKAPDFTEYDEDKCVMGVRSPEEARRVFFASYNDPRFFGSMSVWPFEEFKEKVLTTKGEKLDKALTAEDLRHPLVEKLLTEKERYRAAAVAAGADWDALVPEEFYDGMKEELEHKDITGGDPVLTAKIVLAHLKEDRHYYSKLATLNMAKALKARAGICY